MTYYQYNNGKYLVFYLTTSIKHIIAVFDDLPHLKIHYPDVVRYDK